MRVLDWRARYNQFRAIFLSQGVHQLFDLFLIKKNLHLVALLFCAQYRAKKALTIFNTEVNQQLDECALLHANVTNEGNETEILLLRS